MRRQAIGDFSKIFLNHDHLKILTNKAAHATLTKTIIVPGPKLTRKSARGKQNDGRWQSRGVLAGTWRQWARMTSSPTFFPFFGIFIKIGNEHRWLSFLLCLFAIKIGNGHGWLTLCLLVCLHQQKSKNYIFNWSKAEINHVTWLFVGRVVITIQCIQLFLFHFIWGQ